jgi:histidinol-phosphate phosphatase family protein
MNKHSQNSQPAVFLDRDGTVIDDKAYLSDADGVELLPGAGESLARLSQAGYSLVLVTNQSGVGRGYFGLEAVDSQHRRLESLLSPFGVSLAAIEVCPHAPEDHCECRKPKPTMLLRAARNLNLDLSRSFMIGDKLADVQAGKAAGCATILLGPESPGADHCTTTLLAAAAWILRQR